MVEGNKKYAAEHYPDVELIVADGQNQAAKQVSDVGSLIVQRLKVLIISPVQALPLTPIVKQVMEANIPVVTLDREVNTKVTCRIGAQNRPIGVAAGEFIIEKLHGTGNVIEIEGTDEARPRPSIAMKAFATLSSWHRGSEWWKTSSATT